MAKKPKNAKKPIMALKKSGTRDRAVARFGDCSEVRFMQRREAGLVEIKTFTGKKTLTNAVALFLHT